MIRATGMTRLGRIPVRLAAVLAAAVVVVSMMPSTPGTLAATAALLAALTLDAAAIRRATAQLAPSSAPPRELRPETAATRSVEVPIRQCDPDEPGRVRSRAPGAGRRLG